MAPTTLSNEKPDEPEPESPSIILEKPGSNEPKLKDEYPDLEDEPRAQDHGNYSDQASYLSGYQQDPHMPAAPAWGNILATFNLVAKVRFSNSHLADYLLVNMDLAHQAVFNPVVMDLLDSNPNVAGACILNPSLAQLLYCNPALATVARIDLLINIIARIDPFMTEFLLKNPHVAALTRRRWMDSIQFPHYDLYEEAKALCCCKCKNKDEKPTTMEGMDDILQDVNLDDIDVNLDDIDLDFGAL